MLSSSHGIACAPFPSFTSLRLILCLLGHYIMDIMPVLCGTSMTRSASQRALCNGLSLLVWEAGAKAGLDTGQQCTGAVASSSLGRSYAALLCSGLGSYRRSQSGSTPAPAPAELASILSRIPGRGACQPGAAQRSASHTPHLSISRSFSAE